MELTALKQTVLDKLKPYLEEKKPSMTTERVVIFIGSTFLQLIHVNKTESAIELRQAKTFEFDELGNLPLVLSSFVEKNNLNLVPTYWLLEPTDYQLFLIDALPVPEEEIRAALNWRIRSLIPYPVDEAAIDYFMIPAKKSSGDQPMLGVVISKKSALEKRIQLLKETGLPLMVIDIPEIALKNLSCLYEEDEKCTGFIYFGTQSIILNITRQKTLYFTRQLNLPKNLPEEERFGSISLEIMRYFDYFQSQWRHPPPSRVFLTTERENPESIAKILSEKLMIPVDIFSLAPLLDDQAARSLIEKKYLLAFGLALREGNQHVPTRD